MEMPPEMAAATRDGYCMQLVNEHQTFLNTVRAMPDDQLGYKPHDKIMSFATLARHTAETGPFFAKLIRESKSPDMDGETRPLPETTSALVQECDGLLAEAFDAFQGFTPEQLSTAIDFHGMGPMPGVVYINWHMVHLIHHRAQLGLYLRISGQKVPSVYGPTLDMSFEDMMSDRG
ncbi:MAG: DinB family protein [Planctomycetota bacterium]